MGTMPEQSIKRTIRRSALRQIVPLADSTIYEMEQRGEFPRRFALTTRCVVWDLGEVQAWLAERRQATESAAARRAPHPDVRKREAAPSKRRVRHRARHRWWNERRDVFRPATQASMISAHSCNMCRR